MPELKPVVLPADIFDTLELVALLNDGVGCYTMYESDSNNCYIYDYNKPVCLLGLCDFAGMCGDLGTFSKLRLSIIHNDIIVLNWQKENKTDKKMPWSEYIKAYPIQRGK